MKIISIFAICLLFIACQPKPKKNSQAAESDFTCPTHYVRVPALEGYTANDFCVMKYEAKNNGAGGAISQANEKPYVNINRYEAITKCIALNNENEGKYDLITNDEWQTLVRNIELVEVNWENSAVEDTGGLSTGHSDGSPSGVLSANSDDNESCSDTGQACDSGTWHRQRRTHTLSNGEIIWDVSGNAMEWVKDMNSINYGASTFISLLTTISHPGPGSLSGGTTRTPRVAKLQFGPTGDYLDLDSEPYGGLGHGYFNSTESGVLRGGSAETDYDTGAFYVRFKPVTYSSPFSGFRCTYYP